MSTDNQTEGAAAPSTFVVENFHKTQLDGFIAMGVNLRNLFPDDSEKILGGLCVFFFKSSRCFTFDVSRLQVPYSSHKERRIL